MDKIDLALDSLKRQSEPTSEDKILLDEYIKQKKKEILTKRKPKPNPSVTQIYQPKVYILIIRSYDE